MAPSTVGDHPVTTSGSLHNMVNVGGVITAGLPMLGGTFNQYREYQPYLLGQQLPQVNKFNGEDLDTDGETFQEWIEQFEL